MALRGVVSLTVVTEQSFLTGTLTTNNKQWAVIRWGCTSSCPNLETQFSFQRKKCVEEILRGSEVSMDFKKA